MLAGTKDVLRVETQRDRRSIELKKLLTGNGEEAIPEMIGDLSDRETRGRER